MAAETLKEFLISIRYQRDETGERALIDSLRKQEAAARQTSKFHDELTAKVKTLGLVSATTAATFAAGLVAVAKNYEQLYYIVQRTTASAEGLSAMRFAFQQIGLGADQASAAVVQMQNQMKLNPGVKSVIARFSGDDPDKMTGTLRDQTKLMLDFFTGLKTQAPYVQAAMAGMIGFDPDTTFRIISQLDQWKTAYRDALNTISAAWGPGADGAKKYNDQIANSVTVVRELNKIWLDLDQIWLQAFGALFPDLDAALKKTDEFLTSVLKFNQSHPFASVIEALGSIVVGGTTAITVMRTLFSVIGLGGGGAAAGAGAAAAAGGGAARVGALGVGGALGAGLWTFFHPTPTGNKAEEDAEAKLWAEARRRARTPHYQQGGIVPINADAGEIVLPPSLSQWLLQVSGASSGTGGIAQKTYEALHSMASDIYSWLRGGGLFQPKVQPVGGDRGQPSPFAMLDQYGNPIGAGGGGAAPGHEMVTGLPRPGARPGARWIDNGDPLSIIEHFESGGRNVMNYIGDAMHTASGYWQITNSTWARYANMISGASSFVRAMDAPRDIQRAVAQALYNREGASPWENYNPRLHHYLDTIATTRIGQTASSIRHGDRSATMHQVNNFEIGGAADTVTGKLTRITDRLAGDTLRNFQVALQ